MPMIPTLEAIVKRNEWIYVSGIGYRCEICHCRKQDGHDRDCLYSKWTSGIEAVDAKESQVKHSNSKSLTKSII